MNETIDIDTFLTSLAREIRTLAAGRALTFPWDCDSGEKQAAHVQALAAQVVQGMGLSPAWPGLMDAQGKVMR